MQAVPEELVDLDFDAACGIVPAPAPVDADEIAELEHYLENYRWPVYGPLENPDYFAAAGRLASIRAAARAAGNGS